MKFYETSKILLITSSLRSTDHMGVESRGHAPRNYEKLSDQVIEAEKFETISQFAIFIKRELL